MRATSCSLVLLMSAAGAMHAQRIQVPAHSFGVAAPAAERGQPSGLAPVPATHWKRGAAIGALTGGSVFLGSAWFFGCSGGCLTDALLYAPLPILTGGFIGAMVGGLFPKPPADSAVVLSDARATPNLPAANFRRADRWKGAVLLGALSGTIFGVMVATQAGDEGSDRKFSDRLSDGVVAGAMLAVPVTVIFAMVAGD